MAHAQKPDFVFGENGRVHLNRPVGHQLSWLLVAEVWASVVVMLDTPCSEVVWRVLATHCIRQFPLYFLSSASPCVITFQLDSTFCKMGSTRIKICHSDEYCILHVSGSCTVPPREERRNMRRSYRNFVNKQWCISQTKQNYTIYYCIRATCFDSYRIIFRPF